MMNWLLSVLLCLVIFLLFNAPLIRLLIPAQRPRRFNKLNGKFAVLTGGSGGLGIKIALRLCQNDIKVVIVDKSEPALKEQLLDSLCSFVHCDLSESDNVTRAIKAINASHGTPDILINCAGTVTFNSIENMSIEDHQRIMNVNVNAAFAMIHEWIHDMKAKEQACIVNISSSLGYFAVAGCGSYCASKAALTALHETLRYEMMLEQSNLGLVLVCPGKLDTPLFARVKTNESIVDTTADRVADEILDGALYQGSRTIILPQTAKVLLLYNIVPQSFVNLACRIINYKQMCKPLL